LRRPRRRPHRRSSPAQHRHLRNGAGGSFRYGSYPRNGRPPSAGVFVDLNSTGSQVFGTPRRVSQLFPRGTVIGTIPRICGRMPPPCAISTDGGGTKSIAGDGSSLDKSLRERLKGKQRRAAVSPLYYPNLLLLFLQGQTTLAPFAGKMARFCLSSALCAICKHSPANRR
jgi:hypothetical protein